MIVFDVARGRRTEGAVLGGGTIARLSYDYVEIFWFFSVAANFRWELIGSNPANDVETTRREIEATYGVTLPEPGWWTRYSFVLATAIAIIVIVIVVS